MSAYRWDGEVLTLSLHVQPKAAKDEWSGLHGERLKLRIKAPPIEGRANKYLIEFIAGEFGVGKSDCRLISGESGREKRVAVERPKKFPKLPDGLSFDRKR
ncbi:MAG: DUF167 family protein [Gammaproteobacteria bacterium]